MSSLVEKCPSLKMKLFQKLTFSHIFVNFWNLDHKTKLGRNEFLPTSTSFQRPNCISKQGFYDKLEGGLFFDSPCIWY